MDADDVEVIEKTTPFDGYFRIDRYSIKHRLFEGGWGGEISREIFERGHAACCLLFDPERDALVFIEQFRPGAYAALASPWYDAAESSPWLIEVVAGIIDEGENPEDVVRREALEESGCTVSNLELISHYLVTPGGSTESMFSYCGRVDSSTAMGIHGVAEEGENIRVFVVSADEAFAMMDQGRIINSMTMIAMMWFRTNHQNLRTRWLEK